MHRKDSTQVNCACCTGLGQSLERRRFLQFAAVGGAAALAGFAPRLVLSATGDYEAMLLSCIDPRFVQLHHDYMNGRGLKGKYSQFVIAGGPLTMTTPKFADWHKAFWDNLGASMDLHNIKKVIALSHRDCGAAKLAYGEAAVKDMGTETATHTKSLKEFQALVKKNQPKLAVETGIIDLNGKVQMVA